MRAIIKISMAVLAIVFGLSSCSGGGEQRDMVVPVKVTATKKQKVVDSVSLIGTLAANEAVDLKSEIEGKVESIEFKEGDDVEAGTILFKIDHKKLEAEVAEAKANFDLAKADLSRSKLLLARKTISSQEFDQAQATFSARKATLERANERLDDALVKAPFSGVVGARLVSPGQFLSQGTMLSTVVCVDPLKVEFHVPERFVSRLSKDQAVQLSVAARPDEFFTAKVFFVAPQIDVQTRTILVKARIDNKERKLKPGMFANLALTLDERPEALVIPESAIVMQRDQKMVIVLDKDDRAQFRPVQTGKYLDGMVEIIEGLSAGEKIVAEGIQKVGPGVKVSYEK